MTSVSRVDAGGGNFISSLECRFCMLPDPWRIIHETSNFVVQMGLGPLAEGYVVLLTRTHVPCIAALSDSQLGEFLSVLRLVQWAQHRVYQGSLFFEHGRSGACLPEGNGDDLCYHAHLHLLVVNPLPCGAAVHGVSGLRMKIWATLSSASNATRAFMSPAS